MKKSIIVSLLFTTALYAMQKQPEHNESFQGFVDMLRSRQICIKEKIRRIETIVSNHPEYMCIKDQYSRTVLQAAIYNKFSPALIQALIKNSRYDVLNMQDRVGRTALHYALININDQHYDVMSIIEILMRRGVAMIADKDGKTPIDIMQSLSVDDNNVKQQRVQQILNILNAKGSSVELVQAEKNTKEPQLIVQIPDQIKEHDGCAIV